MELLEHVVRIERTSLAGTDPRRLVSEDVRASALQARKFIKQLAATTSFSFVFTSFLIDYKYKRQAKWSGRRVSGIE